MARQFKSLRQEQYLLSKVNATDVREPQATTEKLVRLRLQQNANATTLEEAAIL